MLFSRSQRLWAAQLGASCATRGDEVAICAWKPRSPARARITLAGRGAGLRERVDNGGLRLLRAWSAAPELRGPMAGSALAEWVRDTVG